MRKKISEHQNSSGHWEAVKVKGVRDQEALVAAVQTQTVDQHAAICHIFNTAYHIAKKNRPFSDYIDLIKLQQVNGVDMGQVLHSNIVCMDIIDHICFEIRCSLVKHIIATKPLISVLIGESTNLGKLSCLIVYMRTTLSGDIGPVTFFLDFVELQCTSADGIEAALETCLTKLGFTNEFLKECWLGIGTDGCSTMLGIKTGVVTRLKSKLPMLVSWHCLNHRLELSVRDAVKS